MKSTRTHMYRLAKVDVIHRRFDSLSTISQGHATAGRKNLVKQGPERLDDLPIDNATTVSIQW